MNKQNAMKKFLLGLVLSQSFAALPLGARTWLELFDLCAEVSRGENFEEAEKAAKNAMTQGKQERIGAIRIFSALIKQGRSFAAAEVAKQAGLNDHFIEIRGAAAQLAEELSKERYNQWCEEEHNVYF